MVTVREGNPTYAGECYVDVDGIIIAESTSLWLIRESVFFVVEPMPDNIYRFFTKNEFSAGLRTIIKMLQKELNNENNRSIATSR